jgi:hypothetical protein
MSKDQFEFSHDESIDRRVPKRLRKSFEKRSAPVAARTSSHNVVKPTGGMKNRRRRHYGL